MASKEPAAYLRLRERCNRDGISMAQLVEVLVADVGKETK